MLRNVFRTRHNAVPGFGSLLCQWVAFAPALVAQPGSGALTGKVADGSGKLIADATVTATSAD
jgi:hypothetical protein